MSPAERPPEPEIAQAREAASELVNATEVVKREMSEAGQRGDLRTNSQAPSWPRYEKARQAWDELAVTLAAADPTGPSEEACRAADGAEDVFLLEYEHSENRDELGRIRAMLAAAYAIDRRGAGAEPTAGRAEVLREVYEQYAAKGTLALGLWLDRELRAAQARGLAK